MYSHVERPKENTLSTDRRKGASIANAVAQNNTGLKEPFGLVDNRPEAVAQRKLQEMANDYSSQQQNPIQKKEHKTGLPDNLKAGIENLSGYSMDDVKVHYNADKPVQLNAHAYAQGTDIHLASGQEKHLPHEVWHVVQQKQGRVRPTMQMKGGVNINDDAGLEKEADVMGLRALQMKPKENKSKTVPNAVTQKMDSSISFQIIQLSKKSDIENKGFSGEEAESLKVVMGNSWGNAEDMVLNRKLTPGYFKLVLGDYDDNAFRRLILERLNEHHYTVVRLWLGMGAEFTSLIKKGLNDTTVSTMIGYPIPQVRGTILSLHGIDGIDNIGYLGKIFKNFPRFVVQVEAEKNANTAQLKEVIDWLYSLSSLSLQYLETHNPNFNVLRVMERQTITDKLISLLPNFNKEVPPGNDNYEALGQQGKAYRVGHFARYHTLRGIQLNQNMDEGKTIFSENTTVANIRAACVEFDDAHGLPNGFPNNYEYDSPTLGVKIRMRNNNHANRFDQMYPATGDKIYDSWVTKLSAVVNQKNDW